MTTQVASMPVNVHVAPASTPADWIQARILVAELVDWLALAIGVDARREQHDSQDELDALEQFYREPHGRMLLGYVGDRPCGTTGVHLMSRTKAELRRVWVAPQARGHGLGSRLLQAGIETAQSLGAKSVWLETVSGPMDTAIGMYLRAGFCQIRPYSSLGATLPSALSLGLVLEPSATVRR